MSFEDLESGLLLPYGGRNQQIKKDPSQAAAAGVFQITTAVASYQRLVNTLGTPKDTHELRAKLLKTRRHIGQLVEDTSAKLREASEADHLSGVSESKKIADAKLAKDFELVLKKFQKAQRLASERETLNAPFVPKEVYSSRNNGSREQEIGSSRNSEQVSILAESKRQEIALLDSEIVFNEAIIEEREQGIIEIQQQIGEVNEIFKDLAMLVHDQGLMIDDISSNVDNAHAATGEATIQLKKASNIQRSNSSLRCLLILIFGIILLIVTVVVVA